MSGRYLEGKNQYLVKLEGVNYRDQAENLRQAELLVESCDRLALEPGEFHVSDLIGMTVILQAEQAVLGTVSDVFTMGHDMLEVVVLETAEIAETAEAAASTLAVDDESQALTAEAITAAALTVAAVPHASMRTKAVQKLKRQAQKKAKKSAQKKAPKTLLIPFVEEIVPVVDIDSGRIEITPPPGLIDL